MCGIVGFTHSKESLNVDVLTSAQKALLHRGPDQQGRFSSDRISLAATRLRVLDMNAGDQPLFSQNRDLVLVFNGEIFNHRELRKRLEATGQTFLTSCDSEVVLHAYQVWGNQCFARLRGMFAIAIWSQSECRLILARDSMGIKPLYYYLHREEIFFGSELKALFVHPEVSRRIDLAALNCYLSMNYVPGLRTLVEGISKLSPGHFLEWQSGRISTKCFSRPTHGVHRPRTLGAACELLDALLNSSVSEQLVSDAPVGMWLSGGLDSSTLLHYAALKARGPLQTFSVTFQGRSFDDGKYIRAVSEHFGTRHHEINLHPSQELPPAIEEMAYYSDEPSADAGAVPLWFLSKLTREKVTVTLSGDGADELFGGYLTYKADRYYRGIKLLPQWLRRIAFLGALRIPVSDEKIGFEYKLKRFLQGSMLPPEAAHVFWNGTFSEEEKQQLCRHYDPRVLMTILGSMRRTTGLARYLEFDQRFYLPDDILYKVDRMSMAHSLEVRPPFLDSRIVDFASALPESMKIRGSSSKHVLRMLMRARLPASVLNRPKVGLDIPIHEWLRSPLREILLDHVSEEAVRQTGLFHWPALREVIAAHLTRKANVGYHLWGILTLMIWIKRWKIQCPGEHTTPFSAAAEGAGHSFL